MLYGGLGLALGSVIQARNKGWEFGQLTSSVENIPIGILVFCSRVHYDCLWTGWFLAA